jgi:hypothetical protein
MDMDTVHPKLSNKIRLEIEKWIKEKYKSIDWEYKQFWIGEVKYKGWQNLHID